MTDQKQKDSDADAAAPATRRAATEPEGDDDLSSPDASRLLAAFCHTSPERWLVPSFRLASHGAELCNLLYAIRSGRGLPRRIRAFSWIACA